MNGRGRAAEVAEDVGVNEEREVGKVAGEFEYLLVDWMKFNGMGEEGGIGLKRGVGKY